jgi:predicted TIM-barrel fold metal-dependent hydrolase
MSRFDFPVFDADNHLYETEDALTRHLPAAHRSLFRFVELKGRKKLLVRDRLTDFIPNPTFEVVARPGAYMPFFKGDNPDGKTMREMTGTPMRSVPAFRGPAARLELLGEQGIDACLMFPTLFSLVEERLKDDPDLTQVAVRAFNEWLYDEWGYDYQGRIFATPVVNPGLLDEGLAELERIIDRGAKAVLMRPAPVTGLRGSRSPFLPELDPFWARVQEAGLVVALHQSDSGYTEHVNAWEGRGGEMLAFRAQAFASVLDGGARAIHDTLASAVCHGMLHRFPGVKLISVENGGDWVPALLHHLEQTYKKMPQEFPEHPVETFKRSVWVNPFWEESLEHLIGLIGAERVCFGSDYPHAEGLAEPLSWIDEMPVLEPPVVQRIVSANMYELLNLQPAR